MNAPFRLRDLGTPVADNLIHHDTRARDLGAIARNDAEAARFIRTRGPAETEAAVERRLVAMAHRLGHDVADDLYGRRA
jgi:hypothetical protein